MPRKTPEQRFWAMVASREEGQCWLWTGHLDRKGYGAIKTGKKSTGAHRFSYSLNVGPIPDGLVIDHLCRVPACVNPAHLEPVTNAENIARGTAPAAVAIRTGKCQRGHEFTEANTYYVPRSGGGRQRKCRECALTRDRERLQRLRVAA